MLLLIRGREPLMNESYWLQLSDNQQYPYTLIKSARAKYVRIKISASGELSVVLPRGISAKHAHTFVQKKAQWILKTLQNTTTTAAEIFPESLDLALLGEHWGIEYIYDSQQENIKLKEHENHQLALIGDTQNWETTKKKLNHWCKQKAKKTFNKMMQELAEFHGFHFNKLSIRSQKTRWGSCATNKNISLNSKLILMPENVVKYVMIHELCHTLEMNHSASFWRLVEDCDSDFKNNRKQLKTLGKHVIL